MCVCLFARSILSHESGKLKAHLHTQSLTVDNVDRDNRFSYGGSDQFPRNRRKIEAAQRESC